MRGWVSTCGVVLAAWVLLAWVLLSWAAAHHAQNEAQDAQERFYDSWTQAYGKRP